MKFRRHPGALNARSRRKEILRGGRYGFFLLLPHLLLLQLLLGPLRAGGQEPGPESYAGFEGRMVAEAELTAHPAMDVEAFRSMVTLKAGQPFSMAALRDSVAARLQA